MDFVDSSLISWWTIFYIKRHNYPYKGSLIDDKNNYTNLLVLWKSDDIVKRLLKINMSHSQRLYSILHL